MRHAFKLIVDNPDIDTLGGRISRTRDDLNLTTAELAKHLGVKTKTVSDWETDRSEPRANRVTMLAGVLGVSPTWLLTGLGEAPVVTEAGSELRVLRKQLSTLREAHANMGRTIKLLESEAARISGVLGQ